MSGTFLSSRWPRSPNRTLGALLIPLAVAVAWVVFGLVGVHGTAFAQAPIPAAARETAKASTESEALARFLSRFETRVAGVRTVDVIAFYRANNSEVLTEFDDLCQRDEAAARTYLESMARRFTELERLKGISQHEYERALKVERMEADSRRLGRRIRELTEALASGSSGRSQLKAELEKAKRKLRSNLAETFTAVHQTQRIEINRLEAEVRELRRMLTEREASRELVIERRFADLTTQPKPGGGR